MTEERQAELLAAWLADPEAPIPEELDADVVETVLALHPERAPAPRVTAASILDLVETGPLAPTVVQPPAVPEPANRGWWKWALAGSSTLVAAALALVVVGVGVVGTTTMRTEAPMDAMSEEGVAAAPIAVDTGVARKAARRAPHAKPSPRPAPRPARPQVAKQPIAEVRPPAEVAEIPDAVVMAEEEEAELDDFVDGDDRLADEDAFDLDAGAGAGPEGNLSRGAGGAVASGAPSPTLGGLEQQIPDTRSAADDLAASRSRELQSAEIEASRAYDAEDRRQDVEEARKAEEARRAEESMRYQAEEREAAEASARRAAAESAAAAKEVAEEESRAKRKAEKKGRSRPRAASAPSADEAEPMAEAPAAPPPPPSDPDLRAAREFLVLGDAASALNAVARGLKRHPTDSRIRQQLFQVRGEAYTALGQAEAATEAYREAAAIGARL